MSADKSGKISRRSFLEQSAAITLIAGAPAFLSRAAEKRPDRMTYDVSKFEVTDPALVRYEEETRLPKIAPGARRIVAGKEGNFLVACAKGAIEFSKTGTAVREITTPEPGRSLAVDAAGTLYIGTSAGIHVVSADGHTRKLWSKNDPKAWITAVAPVKEFVYAADSGNRVVLKYDMDGKIVSRIGLKDKDRNVPGIVLPSPYLDVKVGKDGLLRVNNTGRHAVEVYTTDGDLEFSWGKTGAGIDKFCGCCNPIALEVTADGRYITCEKGLPRVKVYGADGAFECVVAGTESFPENNRHGAARDPVDGTIGGLDAVTAAGGRIYILDLVTADVRIMKPKAA